MTRLFPAGARYLVRYQKVAGGVSRNRGSFELFDVRVDAITLQNSRKPWPPVEGLRFAFVARDRRLGKFRDYYKILPLADKIKEADFQLLWYLP